MIYEVTATDYVLNACGLVCLARPNKECQFFMSASDEKCYLGKDLFRNGQNLTKFILFFKYLSGGLHQGPRLWLPGPYNWSLRNNIGKLSVPSISKEFLDLGNFDTTTSATSVTGTNTVHINYGRYIWITPSWKLTKIRWKLMKNA